MKIRTKVNSFGLVKRLFLVLILGLVSVSAPLTAMAQNLDETEASFQEQIDELNELADDLDDLRMQLGGSEFPVTETLEVRAEVTEILWDEVIDGQRQMEFIATSEDAEYTLDTRISLLEGLRYDIEVGDEVYLQVILMDGELSAAFLVDVIRTNSIFMMMFLFSLVILLVGRWRGAAAIIGLIVTLGILFGFILPMILNGAHPVLVTVVGAVAILAVNMHLSHGFNRQTVLAYSSTVIGLLLAWFFAELFVVWGGLSGLANEEAILLFYQSDSIDWPRGILLAGIILGATGVLDDIAITQSETVAELHDANPKLNRKELFMRAMRVGRHHIASTVNTLVLAYVGVALPLFLLFMHTQGMSMMRFLNEERVAEEIIRTLAGTMALVLTVPISTWLATMFKTK